MRFCISHSLPWKGLLLLGKLSLLFGSAVQAQKSAIDSNLLRYDIDEVVVTAQYAPTDSEQALYDVNVIEAIDIQRQGQNNLSEVLTNQLNLRVSTDPILGNGLQIQGIGGQNVQILIDGVPVIGRVGGNIDLSQINLNTIQRIEIIEGALSAQYGSNASGGVINLITKKSQVDRVQIESQNQYESVGIRNNSLRVGAQFGKVYLSVSGTRFHSQFAEEDSLRLFRTEELPSGERFRTRVHPWNPKKQYGAEATLRYRFSDSLDIRYQYRYFDEVLDMLGERRRPQFQPYAFDQAFTTLREDHSIHLEGYLSPNLYLNATAAYNQYDRRKAVNRFDFETGSNTPIEQEQDTSSFSALLHRSVLSTTFAGKVNGQIGLEVLREQGAGARIVDSSSTPLNEATLSNYAAWLGLRYQVLPSLELAGNLRYGYNTRYDHPLVPAFHLRWDPNARWDMRLSYASGFRAPDIKELYNNFIDINHFIVGNPDLQAERSQNLSFSAEHNIPLGGETTISASAKLFYNFIEDRIVLAEFERAKFNYQNLEQFETNGVNVQLTFQQGDRLFLQSGFGYTRLYNNWSEEFDARRFVGLPEWQNEGRYRLPDLGADLVLTHRFIGRQVRFFQNSQGSLEEGYVGAYHLLNATLSRSFWKERIFLSVGAKNLLDTQEIPVVGQGGGGAHGSVGNSHLLNWGRTWFVRLNIGLGL